MAQSQDTEKGANFQCKHCDAWHGGLYATDVCNDCYNKGKR